jgi:hypothetical protein
MWNDGVEYIGPVEYRKFRNEFDLEPEAPPTLYIAPTWSWASMNSGVRYPELNKELSIEATFISCNIELKDRKAQYGETVSTTPD